ncbi:MAG: calcium-binding protein [Tepidisphaeraceae bacterium]
MEARRLLALTASSSISLDTGDTQQLHAARNANGQTIVVSTGRDGVTGLGDDIKVQRLNAAGTVLGTLTANTTTADVQQSPDVAIDATGRFVVVWQSRNQDGSSWGIYGRMFDANGAALTSEFLVNQTTTQGQVTPTVAMSAAGAFTIAWASTDIDGNSAIYARQYNSSGSSIGAEFQVSDSSAAQQQDPDISADVSGNVVIAWTRIADDTANNDVLYRAYSSSGVSAYTPRVANTTTTGDQFDPSIARSDDGEFVIAWTDASSGSATVMFRTFSNGGTGTSVETDANPASAFARYGAKVAIDSDANFLIAYTAENASDGTDAGFRWFNDDATAAGNALTIGGGTSFRSPNDIVLSGAGRAFDVSTLGTTNATFGAAGIAQSLNALDLSGTAGSDTVSLAAVDSANFSVVINNTPSTYRTGVWGQINFNLGEGNNTLSAASLQTVLNVTAGAGNDTITGSLMPDSIDSGAGDDLVHGNAGNDYVFAGDGNDLVYGEDGNDTLSGGANKNTLYGGNGDDRLNGSGSRDLLYGDEGSDRLYGKGGSDTLFGGGGVDRGFGGDGDDYLSGSSSNDKLYGEAGNDTLNGGKGTDILDGGPGADKAEDDDSADVRVSIEVVG